MGIAYQDDVVNLHLAVGVSLVYDVDSPFAGLLVVLGTALNGSLSPDVELHSFSIMLEPAGKLVLRS